MSVSDAAQQDRLDHAGSTGSTSPPTADGAAEPERASDELATPSGSSVLGHLQQVRDDIVRSEVVPLTKVVPRWKGALAVRYQWPEAGSAPIITAVERAQRGGNGEELLNANADVLIACCAEIVGRVPGGEWEPIDKNNASPVRFSTRLAAMLGIDVPDTVRSPARHIVRHLFSPKAQEDGKFAGDLALLAQAGQVIAWLESGETVADERLQGE